MIRFVARRLLTLVPLLTFISMFVFVIVYLTPGDPVAAIMGEAPSDPVARDAIRKQLGLDQPMWKQYLTWLGRVGHGDFGVSILSQRPVLRSIGERLPVTLTLSGLSMAWALVVALPLGALAALRRNGWLDHALSGAAALGLALPSFWLGTLLILVFAIILRVLPPSGLAPQGAGAATQLTYYVLPALTLGAAYAATFLRFTRLSVLEVITEDYVRTARAKGLVEAHVVRRHIFRNASLAIITLIGLEVGRLFGGAVLTETIFALPGAGTLAISAVFARDYVLLQAITLFTAAMLILSNLAADVAYALLDPRIRFD